MRVGERGRAGELALCAIPGCFFAICLLSEEGGGEEEDRSWEEREFTVNDFSGILILVDDSRGGEGLFLLVLVSVLVVLLALLNLIYHFFLRVVYSLSPILKNNFIKFAKITRCKNSMSSTNKQLILRRLRPS